MADFNVNVPQVQADTSMPVRPVVDNANANLINSVTSAAGGFLDAFGAGRQKLQQQLVKQQTGANEADLEQKLMNLNDARDQGQLSLAQSRMRARSVLSQAISNNPTITQTLQETYDRVINSKGIGDVVAEQTTQEKLQTDLFKQAAQAGFATGQEDDPGQKNAISKWQQWNMGKQKLEMAQAQLTYQRSQIGLTNDQLETISKRQGIANQQITMQRNKLGLAEDSAQFQARSAVGSMAEAYGYKTQLTLDNLAQDVQAGKIKPEDAQFKLQQMKAQIQQEATSQLGGFGSSYVGSVIAPNIDRIDNYGKFLKGEYTKDQLQNQNTIIQAREQHNLISNPETAFYQAASDLFKNNAAIQVKIGDAAAVNILKNHAAPPGTNSPTPTAVSGSDQKQAVRTYLSTIKSGLASMRNGALPKDSNIPTEMSNQIGNMLAGTVGNQWATNNPADYNDVVNFMASPDFGEYMKAHGGALPNRDAVEGAKQVLDTQYTQKAVDTVRKEYLDASTVTGSQALNDLGSAFGGGEDNLARSDTRVQSVGVTFSGSTVQFQARDPNDQDAIKAAAKLNKQAAPVLNNVVRMTAHLDGSTNYKQVWENKFAPQFEYQTDNNPLKSQRQVGTSGGN